MLAYIVSLRNGRRYTIRAEEVRLNLDCFIELVSAGTPDGAKQVVAVFDRNDVLSIISREHLVAEETAEPAPHVVRHNDPIPF
jgi:hypothetical protein